MLIDLQEFHTKVANAEPVSNIELAQLLKELAHFRKATAYLAECQSATLESLPKSASKSARTRHVSITNTAAQLLVGDASGVGYAHNIMVAHERCASAVTAAEAESQSN